MRLGCPAHPSWFRTSTAALRAALWASVTLPLGLAGCNAGDDGQPSADTSAGTHTSTAADAADAPDDGDDAPMPVDDGPSSGDPTDDGPGDDGPVDSTSGGGTTGDATGVDTTNDTGAPVEPPPANAAMLLPWLQAGTYDQWPAESDVHGSAGPHGPVRTFVNDALFGSLTAGSPTHPVDSAAVKELYSAGQLDGWAVTIKVIDGAGADTWYFYEIIGDSVVADGIGDGGCTGCHGAGSVDFFKSPFPLQ